MTSVIALSPSDWAVIGNGGPDEASSRDITSELVAKIAAHPAVYIERGYYKLDPDQVAWVQVDGPKVIQGAGTHATWIGITGPVGINPGHAISMGSRGSRVGGFRMYDDSGTPSRVSTGIYMHAERWQAVEDYRCWGLKAGIQLHGNLCYYWRLSNCELQQCASGLLTTDDGGGEGPNRGKANNILTENNAVGYDLQGGNTMSFFGCNSADEGTGLKSQVNWLRWFGGAFETFTNDAIEVVSGAQNNAFKGFHKASADTILDNGADTIFMQVGEPWILDNHKTIDVAPTSSGVNSILYESWFGTEVDPRYVQRRSGARSWGDGVSPRAHLELGGDTTVGWHLRAKPEIYCGRFRTLRQSVSGPSLTPNIAGNNGSEIVVAELTANLAINNPNLVWLDGQEVTLFLKADAYGPYAITWGSEYNVTAGVDSVPASKAVWIRLKRRDATTIDQVGEAAFVDA